MDGLLVRLTRFFSELRRRHVLRVAAVYAAVAWLIVEVADTTFSILQLPAWAARLVLVLALLGFPLALVLAWAYELTPEGVRRAEEREAPRLPGAVPARAERAPPAAGRPPRRRSRRAAEAAGRASTAVAAAPVAPPAAAPAEAGRSSARRVWMAVFLVLAGAAVGVFVMLRPPPAVEPSIAVLPFQPLSAGAAAGDAGLGEYLRYGLADEIISDLAKVPDLRVIASSSSSVFEGRRDLREIGKALGVDHVLEGSVRREAGRMRVSVSLVRVADLRVRWAEHYDASAGDVMRVQDEIAAAVAGALLGEPDRGEAPAAVAPARDPAAFDLYLQGRYAWYRRPHGLGEAVEKFREALERDPGFVDAYVGLADAYNVMGGVEYGLMPAGEAYHRAVGAARRALALDPNSGAAHAALANALVNHAGPWPEAEAHFRRALQLNPGRADAWHWYSLGLLAAGRRDEAQNAIRRAQMLDPTSAVATAEFARTLYYERRYAEAAAQFRQAAEIDPLLASPHLGLGLVLQQMDSLPAAVREFARADSLLGGEFPLSLALLAHANARLGRRDEARGLLGRIEEMSRQGRYVRPEYLVIAHLGLGEHDRAVALLERAYAENPGLGVMLRLEPLADPLRGHPRFVRLLDATSRR